jgi:hypothetical protein
MHKLQRLFFRKAQISLLRGSGDDFYWGHVILIFRKKS